MGVVGVDEAGKGPVLGSMFAAAVRVRDGAALPETVADSKSISAERRTALDRAIRSTGGVTVAVAEVPVHRIDDASTDMNGLCVEAHARAVLGVARPGDAVRCDAADVDADRFGRRVAAAVGRADAGPLDVEAAHRADERGGVVSAAGIVAKVARDAHVAALAAAYGDVGSGYPGDPTTVRFLEAYVDTFGRLPGCARASWATSERAVAAAAQADLGDF